MLPFAALTEGIFKQVRSIMTDDPARPAPAGPARAGGAPPEPPTPAAAGKDPSPEDPAKAVAEKLEASKIKRVDELSGLARSAWFTLLGALAFAAVTLLSVEHADVLLDNRMIQLPIVNLPVPTRLFLTLGPVVLAVLYFNLHLYLIKLWHAFHYAPADRPAADPPDPAQPGWRLADHIQPWLVNDYALTLKHGSNPRDRSRSFLRNRITLFTVWWATPFVLAWMWCKSLLVREAWITVPVLVCLALVMLIGAHSWLEARRQLGDPDRHRPWRVANVGTAVTAIVMALFAGATWITFHPEDPRIAAAAATPDAAPASWTEAAVEAVVTPLHRPLDIDRRDVVGINGSLPPFAFQREEYRQAWCKIVGVPLDLCAKPPGATDIATNTLIVDRQRHCQEQEVVRGLETYRKCNAYFAELDRRFELDWLGVRRQALAKVTRVSLDGMRLSGMAAAGANLTRADLERTDLARAAMPEVSLEGATLKGATLARADAHGGNLALVNLTGADAQSLNLESAQLAGATLRGADLGDALLRGADLTDANLSGADLTGADLRWARLTRARFDGAILSGAKLTGAIGLTAGQLATAVGTPATEFGVSNTIDDAGNYPTGAFEVADCWPTLPAAAAQLQADFAGEQAQFPAVHARLAAVYTPYLCEEGRAHAFVGVSSGRRHVAPEGNVDRRAPQPPTWPRGKERVWPVIALHWQKDDEVMP
jgi:uncharacterized protein YjbI with pentapeptide repeats